MKHFEEPPSSNASGRPWQKYDIVPRVLYIDSDEAQWEALEIGLASGFVPSTIVDPELRGDSVCALEPVVIEPCAKGMSLVLATATGSWVLLDANECQIAASLARPRTLSELSGDLPAIAKVSLREFLARLYQRGLLRIDHLPGIQPNLLKNGALHHDANLVEIFVTQKCNLGCTYCSAQAGSDMPHLNPDLARRAIDQAFLLPPALPLSIELAGGEPFVNFKLFCDLVLYIEQKSRELGRSVRVFTQTNGTTVTPKIVDFLKIHGISVGVSIDGPADLHDTARPRANGKGSFDQVMRGVSLLRDGGIRFGIITVLTRHNAKHAERMVQFFCELGARSVKINPVNLIGDANITWNTVGISGEEYFEFLDSFLDATLHSGIKLREGNLAECIKNLVFRVHEYRCMRSNCGAGQTFFVVDSRGDIFPCAHSTGIESWRLGSLVDAERAGGFASLGARSEVVNTIARRRVDDMRATSSCHWRHFCEGGCAVNAFQAHGSVASKDPLCSFYEKMYPRLFQRLSTSPETFQALLDGQLGAGVARTETFLLNNHPELYSYRRYKEM
jgi:uncharacterized protein